MCERSTFDAFFDDVQLHVGLCDVDQRLINRIAVFTAKPVQDIGKMPNGRSPSWTGTGKVALLFTISFLIFWREYPSISAISDKPTRSGVVSMRLASGIAFFTSLIALKTALNAQSASLVK